MVSTFQWFFTCRHVLHSGTDVLKLAILHLLDPVCSLHKIWKIFSILNHVVSKHYYVQCEKHGSSKATMRAIHAYGLN